MKEEYIDVNRLKENLITEIYSYSKGDIRKRLFARGLSLAYDIVNRQPTVEVVAKNETTTEVVRCRDCVYCKRFNDVWYLPKRDELLCTRYVETYHTTENDYCSWGERREDETD